MAGSMREKCAGTWEIRFEIGPDPANGRRRQLTRVVHGTRNEARSALRAEIAAVGAGNYRGTSTKFKVLCATWLELQTHNLGPSRIQRSHLAVQIHLDYAPVSFIRSNTTENTAHHNYWELPKRLERPRARRCASVTPSMSTLTLWSTSWRLDSGLAESAN